LICTFYSFKGGAGRSMALANVARWLTTQGVSVTMVDWDLEAPGLEAFFAESDHERELVASQLGVVDMLASYTRRFRHIETQADARDETFAELLDEHLPPLEGFLYPIPASQAGEHAPLHLLPAGWRAGDRLDAYGLAVQSFNWTEFYESFRGEDYFDWLGDKLRASADVVLIDSRTGFTEMGGVCTRHLADVVVSLCAPNTQNLAGVTAMTRSFRHGRLLEKRGRSLETLIVPTRIEVSEVEARKRFEEDFRAATDQFRPLAMRQQGRNFWQLRIPYVPLYAYGERLAVDDESTIEELVAAYQQLAAHIALLAERDERIVRDVWEKFWRASKLYSPAPVPAVFHVPPRASDFAGRAVELDEIRRRLEDSGLAVLSGMAGIGKTALAVEYAHRSYTDYDVAWMMDAQSEAALEAGWDALASALALVPTRQTPSRDVVLAWLERNERWLLIFDGAPSEAALRGHLPRARHGHVFVTTQDATWAGPARLPVRELRAEEITLLLERRFGVSDIGFDTSLESVIGGLPLAVDAVATYTRTSGRPLERVLLLLERETPRVLHSVLTRLGACVAWVAGESARAAQLLELCAQLDDGEIPLLPLLSAVDPKAPLARLADDPVALDDALAVLRRRSLVSVRGDAVRLHPLVAVAVRERLPGDARVDAAESALIAAARGAASDRRLLLHAVAALRRLPAGGAGRPRDHHLARALDDLAARLDDLAWSEEALLASTAAVAAWRRLAAAGAPEAGPRLAGALTALATRMGEGEQIDGAVALAQEAVDLWRSLGPVPLGDHHTGLATALVALSERLAQAGRPEEALRAAEESAAVWAGAELADTALSDKATSLNVLSQRLADLGFYDASREEAAAANDAWAAVATTRLRPAPLTTADVEGIFALLGVEATRRSRQVIGFLMVDGRRTLPLHYVHHRDALPGHAADRLRSALRLEPDEFHALVGGELAREEYFDLLRERLGEV
jgi:MinD-like ATPase involved in chromosome partitioning or flagellar assembly